ncbi:MAG: hypothetical protein RJA07_2385 [Bacteroidota bacterium]|jgi:hypothetical protein
MKKIFTLIAYIIICISCKKEIKVNTLDHVVTVVCDETDSMPLYPSKTFADEVFHFKENSLESFKIRLTSISDLRINAAHEIEILNELKSSALNTYDAVDWRENYLYFLKDSIQKSIALTYQQKNKKSKKYSEVAFTICNEIRWLAQQQSCDKRMYVFSDLLENSSAFSIYTNPQTSQIKAYEKSIHDFFITENLSKKSLQNIQIFFVYVPRNTNEDVLFYKMYSLYKNVLGQHHIKVELKTTNTF